MGVRKEIIGKGIKATKARLAVLKLLKDEDRPLDVNEIYNSVKVGGTDLDLVTVYRVLDKLKEVKLVRQVDFREGKLRYEAVGKHHHHLICNKCKSVQAFYGKCLSETESKIKDKYQFEVVEHVLEFYGVCKACR